MLTFIEISMLILLIDIVGAVIACKMGCPFRNLYFLPMGGWIAVCRFRLDRLENEMEDKITKGEN